MGTGVDDSSDSTSPHPFCNEESGGKSGSGATTATTVIASVRESELGSLKKAEMEEASEMSAVAVAVSVSANVSGGEEGHKPSRPAEVYGERGEGEKEVAEGEDAPVYSASLRCASTRIRELETEVQRMLDDGGVKKEEESKQERERQAEGEGVEEKGGEKEKKEESEKEAEQEEETASHSRWMASVQGCAELLGIDMVEEESLLWIAEMLLSASTPFGYCKEVIGGEWVWRGFTTGEVTCIHPRTPCFSFFVKEARDMREMLDVDGRDLLLSMLEDRWKSEGKDYKWVKPAAVAEHEEGLKEAEHRKYYEDYYFALYDELERERDEVGERGLKRGWSVVKKKTKNGMGRTSPSKVSKLQKASALLGLNLARFVEAGSDNVEEFKRESVDPAEVVEMADLMGVDISTEYDLIDVLIDATKEGIPDGWEVGQDSEGFVYYFNAESGESSWDHPNDDVYAEKLAKVRENRDRVKNTKKESSLPYKISMQPWREFRDKHDKRYFYNFATCAKTRILPPELKTVIQEYRNEKTQHLS